MPISLYTIPGEASECSYLPLETQRMEYRLCRGLDGAEFEPLLSRGWRRFGQVLFRPKCPACVQCRGIRIDVHDFKPSRAQRRALKRNEDVELVVRRASYSADHQRLYDAYHADMHERRDWPMRTVTRAEYHDSFMAGNSLCGHDFLYYRAGRLEGVGVVDLTPNALSAVYFYHAPAWRPLGPGIFSIMRQIEFARATGRRHVYLGFWVSACQSMSYKSQFTPHELLAAFVSDDEQPEWRKIEE